jgi:hypothetical protein
MVKDTYISFELFKDLVCENKMIKGIYIHSYPDAPQLQERIKFSKVESLQFNEAIKIRDNTMLPFWDSLMLSYHNREEFSKEILRGALLHNFKRDKYFVEREHFINTHLDEFLSNNINFAVNSEVITVNNERKHLILLDFHIQESKRNQRVVESVLEAMSLNDGYLLRSGKSYHFIGMNLINEYELINILGKSLFFAPIIDKAWVAHQLIERSCSLRITKKHGIYPTVIKEIFN